uniref:Aminotran_5 domain-containing protein n=1 Tax=Angiostrongylus cantonensis TaxID=6313 RepID=A0A0K0DER9_ANGCA
MLHRVFGERIPEIETDSEKKFLFTSEDLLLWIRENEIGNDVVIETPFGRRYAIYCDYTASARAIRPIEEYILENVLPLYGNTHSSVTVSSEQTTLFVHEARRKNWVFFPPGILEYGTVIVERKRYNTLSVWDYASSAPYVKIEVNGVHPIDAVFFSGHKFIGGVSTPG